ncbi:MAG: TonB-dependent receptor, partial [Bacteroidetes bacterium]|nr:TonB-dependent receptor [Bacteroidota bacterium]
MNGLKPVFSGVFVALITLTQLGFAQNGQAVLSGYLREAGSRESLPGAAVYFPSLKQGTTANAFGFYSITIPPGRYAVQFSFVGMTPKVDTLDLSRSLVHDVELAPGSQLTEIEIVGDAADQSGAATLMSRMELSGQQIGAVPTLMGEKDLLKTVQLLPGVQSGNEGQSGLYVRGGGPDQNLILLDGATVYNASHLFGFFSVFNGDAIKQVSLTKGGFPARYGGRLSSVLDVTMRDGDKNQYRGEFGLGVISSRFLVEGPIVRNKISFVAAGRRTYADALLLPAQWITGEDPGVGYYFYDLSGRVHYEINRKNRLFLSTYTGRDAFASRQERDDGTRRANISWGNVSGTLRWNHLASERLFVNTTLIYTDYEFNTFLSERFDARNITAGYS